MKDFVVVLGPDGSWQQILEQGQADGWEVFHQPVPGGSSQDAYILHKSFTSQRSGQARVKALGLADHAEYKKIDIGDRSNVETLIAGGDVISSWPGLANSINDILSGNVSPAPAANVSSGAAADQPKPTASTAAPAKPEAAKPDKPEAAPKGGDPLAALQPQLWSSLGKDKQATYADAYFADSLAALQWATAPELVWLEQTQDAALKDRVLRDKLGVRPDQGELDNVHLELQKQRLELVKAGVDTAKEMLSQMKRWTKLSDLAPALLWFGLVAATLGMIGAFILTAFGKVDGPTLALLIFVLGVFAISPAVLLLLERPLKGMDAFTPSGAAGDDAAAAEPDTKTGK